VGGRARHFVRSRAIVLHPRDSPKARRLRVESCWALLLALAGLVSALVFALLAWVAAPWVAATICVALGVLYVWLMRRADGVARLSIPGVSPETLAPRPGRFEKPRFWQLVWGGLLLRSDAHVMREMVSRLEVATVQVIAGAVMVLFFGHVAIASGLTAFGIAAEVVGAAFTLLAIRWVYILFRLSRRVPGPPGPT